MRQSMNPKWKRSASTKRKMQQRVENVARAKKEQEYRNQVMIKMKMSGANEPNERNQGDSG